MVAQTFKYFGCEVIVMRIMYIDGEKERDVTGVTEDGSFTSVTTNRVVFIAQGRRDTEMLVDFVRRVFAAEEADRGSEDAFDRRSAIVPVLRIALDEGVIGGVSA